MIKKILALVAVFCLTFSVCAFALPSGWAIPEIETAKRNDLVPEALLTDYQNAITREEFCSLAVTLYEKLSKKDAPKGTSTFSDTDNADVNSAYALGIVNGIGDGLFAPSSLITREEIAAMFLRCIKAAFPEINPAYDTPNTYPDAQAVADWAKDAVKFVNMCEIMVGDQFGNINPKNNTTREQAIVMVLRIYNAFKSNDNFLVGLYGFSTSGNSATNMANGSFAIKNLKGELYVADNSGIFKNSDKSYITKNKSLAMYVDSDEVYYIKASDKALYKINLSDLKETKIYNDAVAFSVAGEYIYIKNSKNTLIAIFSGKEKVVANDVTSTLSGAAASVYYSTNDGIYCFTPANGETTEIYKESVSSPVLVNNEIYFKNADGVVCKIDLADKKVSTVTTVSVNDFCVYSGALAYTTDDGLYKADLDKKFNIKLSNDGNCKINCHEKTLYIKSADGKVTSLNIYTGEKTALN